MLDTRVSSDQSRVCTKTDNSTFYMYTHTDAGSAAGRRVFAALDTRTGSPRPARAGIRARRSTRAHARQHRQARAHSYAHTRDKSHNRCSRRSCGVSRKPRCGGVGRGGVGNPRHPGTHDTLLHALHGPCLAAAPRRFTGELGFHRRSRAQRRSPLKVRGRLLELRRRARPHLPSAMTPAQHESSHLVGYRLVRRRALTTLADSALSSSSFG